MSIKKSGKRGTPPKKKALLKRKGSPVKKNKTNRNWVNRHLNDPYVKKAQGQGYRSRAVFKLEEVDKQDQLFNKVKLVADLGSAPGGWCQYIRKNYPDVEIVAIDILDMEPVEGVKFLKGDFTDTDTLAEMNALIDNRMFDLVISDIAPNITGVRDVDDSRYQVVLDAILDFCDTSLKKEGSLLVKIFEGGAAARYRNMTKKLFQKNSVRKPLASRAQSKEFYYLSQRKKLAKNKQEKAD